MQTRSTGVLGACVSTGFFRADSWRPRWLALGTALACTLAPACARRSAAPAEAPESAEPGAPDEAASSGEAEKEESEATNDGDGADEGADGNSSSEKPQSEKSGAEAPKEDLAQVLQTVLDDQELEIYWHFGEPGRLPVLVAGDIPPELELVKGGKPVKVVDVAEKKDKPVFVFTEIAIRGDRANVRYRYDVAKVRGSAVLERRHGRWELTRSRVSEH